MKQPRLAEPAERPPFPFDDDPYRWSTAQVEALRNELRLAGERIGGDLYGPRLTLRGIAVLAVACGALGYLAGRLKRGRRG